MAKAKRSTAKKKVPSSARPRSQSVRGIRRNAAAKKLGRWAVPLILIAGLLVGIGFFGLIGYRTATASGFFAVRKIEVRGTERSSIDDIKRIVAANTEKSGVWQADLSSIREKIEKLPFVRTVSVSMILPAGIRVNVTERVPAAIVRLPSGDVLVYNEGVILAPAAKPEPTLPFALKGWDESKTDKAPTENLARLKMYKKILDEAHDLGIADRIKEVNFGDMRDPTAVITDGGKPILVVLAKDNLGKSLKSAIEAVAGKGERVKAVNAVGISPILEYLGN